MLIIFDCDGVLVDSEVIANRVLHRHIQALGLSLSEEKVRQHFRGLSMATVVAKLEKAVGKPLPEDFLGRLQTETFGEFQESLQPVTGVAAVLDWLQERGIPMCVASSGTHDKMELTLGLTGLRDYFGPDVFSAGEVKRGKPAPDLFLYAARQMGHEPSDCVVVEDALPGVRAARAAGMQVFAYCEPPVDAEIVEKMMRSGAQCFYSMANLPHYLDYQTAGHSLSYQ